MVGVSFVAMGYTYSQLFLAVALIGCVTFVISFLGVLLGRRFGRILGSKAEIVGGVVPILIGVKVFCEGIGII
jgi:putative Mn2+ efflux pump MntP